MPSKRKERMEWNKKRGSSFCVVILGCPWDFQGEGSGTPLQYSCLENPMDGGTWKAAV